MNDENGPKEVTSFLKMVLFDILFCESCDVVQELWGWSVISSTVDVIIVMAAIVLVFGYAIELPIWIALNIGVNMALKYIINEPRPSDCGCGPGFPSGHSQMATFLLIVFFAWKYRAWYNSNWPKIYIVYQGILATVLATLVVISRPVLTFHSTPQTLVGIAVGAVMGLLYIFVHEYIIKKCYSKKRRPEKKKRLKIQQINDVLL